MLAVVGTVPDADFPLLCRKSDSGKWGYLHSREKGYHKARDSGFARGRC